MARKMGFFMAWAQSLQRSRAVEQLAGLARPCGLAKLLLAMPRCQERRFISRRKSVTLLARPMSPSRRSASSSACASTRPSRSILATTPPTSATRQAASLPLGSIIPKKRSCSEQAAPCLSSAVVPIIAQLFLLALTRTRRGSTPPRSTSSSAVIRFIILVRLAISRFLQFRFPDRQRPSFSSYSIQLFADTSGMSVRSSSACPAARRFGRSSWQERFRVEETERSEASSLRSEGASIAGSSRASESESCLAWLLQEPWWEVSPTTVGRSLSLCEVLRPASGGKRMAVAQTCIAFNSYQLTHSFVPNQQQSIRNGQRGEIKEWCSFFMQQPQMENILSNS